MIVCKDIKGNEVYVTTCNDIGANTGGLYCQVYADENLEIEIDYFAISKYITKSQVENVIRDIIENEDYSKVF